MLERRRLYMIACSWFFAASAFAWNGTEHTWIGRQAYHAACEALFPLYESRPELKARLNIACGKIGVAEKATGEYANERLFGEWTALAADHADQPEQLLQVALSDVVADYRHFAMLAVSNYRHFHPACVTSWRDYHRQAVDSGLLATKHLAISQAQDFEAALAIEAFAQHYLHDSFSAGHMGFNRVASSNAAALSYHERASRTGRCVRNLNGDVWFTLGDDHLGRSDAGSAHVLHAAALSIADVISAFVSGEQASNLWSDTWSELPLFIKDVPLGYRQGCDAPGEFRSLRSVSQPAESATTIDVMTVNDSAIYRPSMQGIMLGISRELTSLPLGYRQIQTRGFVSIGMTTRQLGRRAILLDGGYLWHIGTTNRGILTHELGFGEQFYFETHSSYRSASLRGLYAVNLEAGRVYLRLQVGESYSYGFWGSHVSAGLGWVKRASR